MNEFTTILTSAGFATVCTTVFAFLTRSWISQRLKQSIGHEYAQKLELYKASLKAEHEVSIERLRSDFARTHAIAATASASFHEAHRIGLERRLTDIGRLWDIFLLVDKATPPVVFLQDMLTKSEYPKIFTDPKFSSMTDAMTLGVINKNLGDTALDADSLRPFVGEYLWQIYFAYRALKGRLCVLIEFGKDPDKRDHWSDDSGVKQILESVLTESEIIEIYRVVPGSCKRMFDLIKQKYLVAASKIISGEASASDGLEQATRIAAAISQVSIKQEA